MKEIDYNEYITTHLYGESQSVKLEDIYQAFKERMEKEREEDARSSLERNHQCSFRNVKNKYGKEFGMCSCGALLAKTDSFTDEDFEKMREEMRTPGAVFKVVEE